MNIYVVTKEKQDAKRCGEYKSFICYVMDFYTYREKRTKGTIFIKANQALNYMLRNG